MNGRRPAIATHRSKSASRKSKVRPKRTAEARSFPRIGFGYDIHRFSRDRKLILGGVEIPSNLGLLGHSDADVLLHAMCDALLGAAALKDIGYHFPDSDERFKGISSLELLSRVGALVRTKGYEIGNIDSTLILETPKIAPFISQMVEHIGRALVLPVGRISIKATTNEQIGSLGRSDGCAAMAVALLVSTGKQ